MKNASQLREIAEMNNCLIEKTITDIGIKCEEQARLGNNKCIYVLNPYQLKDFNGDKTLIDDLITILENDYEFKVNIIRFTEFIFDLEINW